MSTITWLLITHFIFDFLFQTEWQATHKAKGRLINRALLAHCSIYTLGFLPVILASGLHAAWLLFIFGTHVAIDTRRPIIWWRRAIMQNTPATIAATEWLTIVVDQIFHILVLVAVVVVTS